MQIGSPQPPRLSSLAPRLPVRHRSIHRLVLPEPRLAFNRIVVVRYRMRLESRGPKAKYSSLLVRFYYYLDEGRLVWGEFLFGSCELSL